MADGKAAEKGEKGSAKGSAKGSGTGSSGGFMNYFEATRGATYSFLFALPLFLIYEFLSWMGSDSTGAGIRNGADVLVKSLLAPLGIRSLPAFAGLLAIAFGIAIYRENKKRRVKIIERWFIGMLGEAVIYAFLLAPAVNFMMTKARLLSMSFTQEFTVMLGAGLYEELVFRVMLIAMVRWSVNASFSIRGWEASVYAVIISSLIFSGFHHIGAYGEAFTWSAFVFRALAGGVLSVLYILRGFGITAYSHAIYDLLILFTR